MNILAHRHLMVLIFASSVFVGTQALAHDGAHDEATKIEAKENCGQHAHAVGTSAHSDTLEPCTTNDVKQQPATNTNMQHNHGNGHSMPMNMSQMDHSKMNMPAATPPSK